MRCALRCSAVEFNSWFSVIVRWIFVIVFEVEQVPNFQNSLRNDNTGFVTRCIKGNIDSQYYWPKLRGN